MGSERRGTKGLELWCRRMTEGYPGVNVVNMTTSWRDGLAFCAIIHHFRPDLIEFSKLNKDDIYHNNELAFRTAERHLGIPALLEPEDMVDFPVPDRLSILTYLSQFYQTFVVREGKSPSRIPSKRPSTSPEHTIVSPASSSPPTKVAPISARIRRDPCAKCNLPVFIAERLNVGKLLYHRTCFRCARCNSQLTLANYYKTEGDEYCCETCPDEEKPVVTSVLSRSVSDEEKSATLKNEDEYSSRYVTALEHSRSLQFSKARSFFAQQEEERPPELPKTKPPELPKSQTSFETFDDSEKTETFDDSGLDKKTTSGSFSKSESVTKETSEDSRASSLVKARMKLFEKEARGDDVQVPLSENTDTSRCSDVLEDSPKETNEEEDEDSAIDEETSIPVIEISDETIPEEVSTIEISHDEGSISIIEILDDTLPPEEVGSQETVTPEEAETHASFPEEERGEDEVTPTFEDAKPPIEEYPEDLDPFRDEVEVSLNPFEEDDDDDTNPFNETTSTPLPTTRKKIQPSLEDKDISLITIQRISVNPFEDVPQPARRKIKVEDVTLNPFWSDDEDNEEANKPVPKPRLSKPPEPKPRESGWSLSSLSSGSSVGRRKKPAPRPPAESGASSLTSSPSQSVTHSPRGTPKPRKSKKAPLPPSSTPVGGAASFDIDVTSLHDDFEQDKFIKDERNRNRQSQNLQSPSSSEASMSLGVPDKSTYGKWKRKKGQAPERPIPQRRNIKSLPMADIRRELELIEVQQQGLEKQGVRLERMIREKCEGPGVKQDESLCPEVEDMILQLFELVNEKNALFRNQATLMYLRRQHKLEEEHADIEYQIRCLMLQPEANKTDLDKSREEELINRLVDVVERRNEIIECLEMDRLREAEEDDGINSQLNLYNLKKEGDKSVGKESKKEKKKQKKKKGQKIDADKDIDESESAVSSAKDKKKTKFLSLF